MTTRLALWFWKLGLCWSLVISHWSLRLFLIVLFTLSAAAQPPTRVQTPPLPPSPVQEFREWLAMKPDDRAKAVAGYPADKQKVLLQKLLAYEVLPPEERERRLQMLELRWFMRPLMAMKPEERRSSMELVPVPLRRVVQERLAHWDALDSQARKEILDNDNARELVARYFGEVKQGRAPEDIIRILSPERRAELEIALKKWNSPPPASRGRSTEQLTAFFRLSRAQQERTFEELPESERQDIQKTLDIFAKLSPEQRRVCVESFDKFALLPPPERASFLRNAARWQQMTPQDRAAWKQLVTKLPPLPPTPVVEPPKPEASSTGGRTIAQTNLTETQ
jgi:hypothetical protein